MQIIFRITNLENLSKSKDLEIDKLNKEIRVLKKIQRDHEKILEKSGNSEENEYVKKVQRNKDKNYNITFIVELKKNI